MTGFSRRHALLLAGTGLALAACGTGSPAVAPSAGPPRPGGTLRYGAVAAGGTPVTDPHGSLLNESDWVRMGALYDVLVVPGSGGTILPRLATTWSADSSATRWRFDLRTDAVFSDGRPVRAADVLYSLRRIAQQSVQNGDRLGTVDITQCAAPDDHTVLLVTSQPDADLPAILAGVTFVVPEGTTTFDHPVGSGPFVISTMDSQAAALARNDRWWGPRTLLDRLEIRGFADPQAMASAVTSGEIDVAAGVEPATARVAERTGSLRVSRRPAATAYPLLMRIDKPPFDRDEVRRAVKLAVDRKALVDTVFLGYGAVGSDLPDPNDRSFPRDVQPPARNVAQARQLLASAGYAGGLDVVLNTTTAYPGMVSAATLLAQQLGEAGIRAQVRQISPETYWTQTYTVEPLTTGYYTDVPFPVWVRQTALSTSAYNETAWKKPDFDAAFAKAMGETDARSRDADLGSLQRQMAAEGGWLVWGFGDGLDVVSQRVQALPSGSGFSRIFLEGVWLRQ